MNKTVFISFFLGLVFLSGCRFAPSSQNPSVTEDEPQRQIQLFNGRSLNGWYTFLKGRGRNNDPKEVFTVKDGMIRISGEELKNELL